MNFKNIELSIIIPSFQEEENLNLIIPKIQVELNSENIKYQILIIDTISPLDRTKMVCEKYNCTYINREIGNTYGDAVRTGIKYAEGENILFMDADGSHSPEFIKEMLKSKKNSDLVIASRYIAGGNTENSKILILMSRLVNIGYRLVLGIKVKDISNSFKLYNGQDLKRIILKCNNFDVVEEILFKLVKMNRNLRIIEIPFCFKKRIFGTTKRNLIIFVLTYIFTLIRLRFFT